MALTDCKCRIVDQTLLKKVKVCFVFQFFCAVFYKHAYQFLKLRNEREQYDNCCHTEHCVQGSDRYWCHDHIHKSKMYDRIRGIEDNGPHDKTKQVIHKIDECCSLTVLICTDRRDQYRTGCADTDTKYDRECTCKGQDTCYGKSLQHTDCRRCTLKHSGEQDTY